MTTPAPDRRRRLSAAAALPWLALLLWAAAPTPLPAADAAADGDASFTVRVRMERPHTRRYEVELECRGLPGPAHDFKLPVWTPGFYQILDYPKYVGGFRAEDDQGRPLPWEKTSKNVWRVRTGGAPLVRVAYEVFAPGGSIAARYASPPSPNQMSVTARSFWRNTRSLLPLLRSMRCTSDGHSKESKNSIKAKPAPCGLKRIRVICPNRELVEDFQLSPPSRLSRIRDSSGHCRLRAASSGSIQAGRRVRPARGGWLEPTIISSRGGSASIQVYAV